MSDQFPEDQPITYTEDIQALDLDADQRALAENDLEMPESVDDVPWTPPQQRPMGAELLEEDGGREEETIDQRVMQEEPEQGTAYGAPESGSEVLAGEERVEMLGGDDPDAIPAGRDVLDGPA